MQMLGQGVLWVMMFCAFLGAVASIRSEESGLGREFLDGLRAIGHIFVPVAGVMASIPYLDTFVRQLLGPAFAAVGADPAMAAATFIAVDMGGYQLAHRLAATPEAWILASFTAYVAGATIVFSIPTGLALLPRKDWPSFAMGVLYGVLAIPIAVVTAIALLALLPVPVRAVVSTEATAPTTLLQLNVAQLAPNLIPLVVFCGLLAAGLKLFPAGLVRGFLAFGKGLDAAIKLVLVASIIEYFTQVFSHLFGGWGFDPIIADSKDPFRALEVAGYIGVMLSGAFPFVYLLRQSFSRPLEKLAAHLGLSPLGAAGIIASSANILAMLRLLPEMRERDKVLNVAYAVCAAFLLGDHLAFTANFQPNLIPYVAAGKLVGGLVALGLASRFANIPTTELAAHAK